MADDSSVSTPHSLARSGTASLSDILTSLRNEVVAVNNLVLQYSRQFPSSTSGQVSAAALIQTGFVRLLGISVVASVTAAAGGLYDAATLSSAGATQQVGVLLTTPGFYAVDMVFANGLVAKPAPGQIVSLHYARV